MSLPGPCISWFSAVVVTALVALGCEPRATAEVQSTDIAAAERAERLPSAPPAAVGEERSGGAPATDVVSQPPSTKRSLPPLPAGSVEQVLKDGPRQHWYGVYMMGKKVGYAEMLLRRGSDGDPGALMQKTSVSMEVTAGANTMKMQVEEVRWYGAEAPHPLLASSMLERTPLGTTRRSIKATEEGLSLTISQPDQEPQERVLPATRETLEGVWATMPLSLEGVVADQQATVQLFDWPSEADTQVRIRVRHVGTTRRAGLELRVATLGVRYERLGLETESRVAEGGSVLETRFGAGLALRLEDKGIATSGVEGLDILASGVAVNRPLGRPGDARSLELRVWAPEGMTLPNAPNQRVVAKEDGWSHVTLSQGPGEAVGEGDLSPWLGPAPQIDSDGPTIVALAKRLVSEVDGRENQVARIQAWVYENLEKALATHIPTASGVLRLRRGDCTEHTWLFVALCRAAGIPARPAYGLMYLGDQEMSFGYHAWAEVAVGGKWLPVDPTWNQRPVDATHLRFGDRSSAVAQALGQVRIEVPEGP